MKPIKGRTFATQNTMFDEIVWFNEKLLKIKEDDYSLIAVNNSYSQRGAPEGVEASGNLGVEKTRPPYWEFDWAVDTESGLSLSNIKVRDTQSEGSTELVFESLKFADLEITFTDGSRVPFDIEAALNNTWPGLDGPGSSLLTAENGYWPTNPPDEMYQRGIRLRLVTNVLAGIEEEHWCDVTLDMTVVFRGAANDFDPGGVPVAMVMWPQLSWKWDNTGASKTVKEFRGSVVLVMQNTMFGTNHGNLSSLFTDSNTSMLSTWRATQLDLRALGGRLLNQPFGWGMVFDYATPAIKTEREVTGVYGPNDGAKFTSSRSRWYSDHTPALKLPFIEVDKKPRQGDYDNIHTHAKMTKIICENEQVHAPFCGHSCVHLHWRWSNASSEGALNGRGWQYKGWSSETTRSKSRAFDAIDAPLIPPNQRLKFAILAPGSVRYSRSNIVKPSSPKLLPADRKKYWYTVDIIDPPANQNQVIFEHGIGWAYRYSLPSECPPLKDMARMAIISPTLGFGSPTQAEVAAYFADSVYPVWRYLLPSCVPQVPTGSYSDVVSGTPIAMEDL